MQSRAVVGRCLRRNELLGRGHGFSQHAWSRNWRSSRLFSVTASYNQTVNRLSAFWIPTGGIEPPRDTQDAAHSLLTRAGYLRQAHSGIFHMLPLGHRVQQKLEALIDKHMASLGASKVSLSSISSEELWEKTGRFVGHGGELFAFNDRKEDKFLLAPTHEEEITALVASTVQSYKDLPLRLYQVTRKYRDEARPRGGLLRGREFIMKDLYTFDHTEQQAHETYQQVQQAYKAFLNELKLPYLVAKADSGNMGGNLSHEYHFVSPKGEDNVISCDSCGSTINDELALVPVNEGDATESADAIPQYWCGITKDKRSLVMAWFPQATLRPNGTDLANKINLNVIKAVVPDLDTSVEDPLLLWDKANPKTDDGLRAQAKLIEIVDETFPPELQHEIRQRVASAKTLRGCEVSQVRPEINGQVMQLKATQSGDTCRACGTGTVKIDRAIEIGHTFHLGTRYSKPLEASVTDKDGGKTSIEMGCHGIGVSRLVGAVASMLCDDKGLNWPAAIAPFQAVFIPGQGNEADAEALYRKMHGALGSAEQQDATPTHDFDAIVDDRAKPMGWKLNDADLVGYPLIVILGRAWKAAQKVEVQCRRLGLRAEVHESELAATLADHLRRL